MQLTAIYITCHLSKICYIRGQLHHDVVTGAKQGEGRRGAPRSGHAPAQPAPPVLLGIFPVELNGARTGPRQMKLCRFLGIRAAWGQQGERLMPCFNMSGNAQAARDRGRGRMKNPARCNHPASCDATAGVTTADGICTRLQYQTPA